MEDLFLDNPDRLAQIALVTVSSFVTLFLLIRISGKRTLAKLSAFDFIVTVALGSTLAYMMLAQVPLAEGATVLLLVVILQYVFAWAARLSPKAERLINSAPQLLYYNGTFLEKAMSRAFVTHEELHAAVRGEGIEFLADVRAIIMEINGDLTVVKKSNGSGPSSIEKIVGESAFKQAAR